MRSSPPVTDAPLADRTQARSPTLPPRARQQCAVVRVEWAGSPTVQSRTACWLTPRFSPPDPITPAHAPVANPVADSIQLPSLPPMHLLRCCFHSNVIH